MIELIHSSIINEKSYIKLEENKYMFEVDKKLNKLQIKQIFETIFATKIISVNTYSLPRKKKRAGMSQGYKSRLKRVIIKTKPNNPITLFNNF